DNGDAGGEDIASSLTTSESVHVGIGTGAGIEILAVVRYAVCGGGVAADSSVSNGSHALDLGHNLAKVVPEERPLRMGPLASQVA
nr:hypothetical protein [Tanacetum cinerariifolium]